VSAMSTSVRLGYLRVQAAVGMFGGESCQGKGKPRRGMHARGTFGHFPGIGGLYDDGCGIIVVTTGRDAVGTVDYPCDVT